MQLTKEKKKKKKEKNGRENTAYILRPLIHLSSRHTHDSYLPKKLIFLAKIKIENITMLTTRRGQKLLTQ